MEKYRNSSSGINSYEIGENYIKIKFKSSFKVYKYSHKKAGFENVETMKMLAENNSGLNSYINSNVKNLYD